MSGAVCPACYDGVCGECIGAGCYCDCQLEELIDGETRDLDRQGGDPEEDYDGR
jgi:hypothetical protein